MFFCVYEQRKKEVENMGKFEKDGISNLRRAYIEGSKRSRFDT